MINELDLCKAYLKLFFKKWYTLLSIVFNILGWFLLFFVPSMIVIVVIVLFLSFLGIISSGYFVYHDLFKIIPEDIRLAYLPPKIGKPEIKVFQSEGNEYSYGYMSSHNNRLIQTNDQQDVLPRMACEFNLIIKNTGYIQANILSISGQIDITQPLQFMIPEASFCNNEPYRYPIELRHGEEKKIILFCPIFPYSLLTDAQIAVRIRELLSLRRNESLDVSIEFSDTEGKITRLEEKFCFSTEPLFKLFIDNWRSMNEKELLSLVGDK